jgi:hypothetical protein
MNTLELERAVLGDLIFKPCLLQSCDLHDTDFAEGVTRQAFRAISEMVESDRSEEIDPVLLKQRIGGNAAGTFVGSLMDGRIKPEEPVFCGRVTELRKKRITAAVLAKVERQAKSGELNLDEIRPDLERYEELKKPKGQAIVRQQKPPFTGTLADFFNADLPEAEVVIKGLLSREEFMLMGGVKHAHKTTAMMDLGLHFADGRESWLNFPIPRPGRFLMVQQELGEGEFRKRLQKAVDGGRFDPSNFFPYTGTGDPIKLMDGIGFKRLCELCDKFKPDIIGLDPLHTFMVGGENRDEAFAAIRDRINYLKTVYNCAVITSHHFSSKRPKDDPDAPVEAGGWFRGHSVLSDAADVLFLLHRLPGQKDNPNLRLAYEDYNQVEITLRNGKWPPRFATEFNEETFLLRVSDVWHEVGAKIGFGEVREYCEAQGGSVMLKDLIVYFQIRDKALSPMTVKKAVEKEAQAGYIVTEKLPGRGNPLLIKSRTKT